jgi:hypothetical protein
MVDVPTIIDASARLTLYCRFMTVHMQFTTDRKRVKRPGRLVVCVRV